MDVRDKAESKNDRSKRASAAANNSDSKLPPAAAKACHPLPFS